MIDIVSSIITKHFLNIVGLWTLLALIPLILVYLIRPRPKKQTVPALMFLIKERSKANKTSFLRRLFKDPLLFFQLLLLITFAVAIAKPFITVTEGVFVERTALILDVSGSSHVTIDGTSRFERVIDIAKDNLGKDNVIILIGAVPELVTDGADLSQAKSILRHLKMRDTPTNLFDSIVFAGNYIKEGDRVVVISDFIETSNEKNYHAAKEILESKGVIVDFIDVRDTEPRKAFNLGIIETSITDDETTIQIKNYNDKNETIGIRMDSTDLSIPEFTIASKDVEVITFPTPKDVSKFWIVPYSGDDDFELDNTVYIVGPKENPISILMMSNSVSKYLSTALDVIDDIEVDKSVPPQIPNFGHQIIIYNNVESTLVLPSTMKKIKKKVEAGAALIVVAQEGLMRQDFLGMLPVEPVEDSVMKSQEVFVSSITESSLTEDINFGMVSKYLDMRAKDGSINIAITPDNSSIIAMKGLGKGIVFYVGFMDKHSTFKEDIYYPVFWKRLFDMLAKKQDISNLNFQTGKLVNLLGEQNIKTPFGKIKTDSLVLTKQGIYTGEDRIFVANLVDEKESDVNGEYISDHLGIFEEPNVQDDKVPLELTKYLIIGLLILVFIELIWIKFRGDL